MDPARADWSSRWFNREEEVEQIKAGPDADGWDERDRAMLRAADELNSHFFSSEPS